MFFGNKKNEEKQEENFVVSDYAMERYKKSQHYNKVDLTNEEIEFLFCDKKDWNTALNSNFSKALEKGKVHYYDYSYIVFPEYTEIFEKSTKFYNCIFYGNSLNGEEDFLFKECSFPIKESPFDIKANSNIYFYSNKADRPIEISHFMKLDMNNNELMSLSLSNDFINTKKIKKINMYNNKISKKFYLSEGMGIDTLTIDDLEINEEADKFYIQSPLIINLHINRLKLNEINCNFNELVIENLEVNSSQFSTFFDLKKVQNNCNINYSKIKDFKGFNSSTLDLKIQNSELTFSSYDSIKSKSVNINDSKVNKLKIYDTKNVSLSKNNFRTLDLSDNIKNIYITNSTVENKCSFTHLKNKNICVLANNTFKKGVNFRFASINKLAIYKSSFKELDFDCSFINEARFSQVKGLNEANEVEEIFDKHFASKESLRFFEKVTKI